MGLLGSIMDIGHTTGPLASGVNTLQFGYPRAFAGAPLVLIAFALIFLSGVGMGKGE